MTLFATSDVGIGTTFSLARLFGVLSDRSNLETHADIFGLLLMYAGGTVQRLAELVKYPPALAALVLPVLA